jgi:hypothetical protein
MPLWGRRWPFQGIIIIQQARRWPLWGSCNLLCVPNKPSHTAICSRKRPTSPGWRPIHQGHRPICKGLIPIGQSLPKRPDEGILLLLHAGARQNSVLPLPSQQPSDGLFSPMEVRTNHLPMCTDPLVPVRRAWSCTSKTTPSMGSSVLDIIAM